MERKLTVPTDKVAFLIEQAYNAGRDYQWARETLVNALQAHATWVEFGIEKQLIAIKGVAKRYVADNGIGMNDDELLSYMSSFGGGGKPIGHHENFGQGQKASCYPWNTYGMIVVSWTQETPEGRMIWIHRGSDGDFSLRNFSVVYSNGEEGYSDIVEPGFEAELGIDMAQLKLPEIEKAGQGTVFLFLGDSLERDTDSGDFLRGEKSLLALGKYLNSRFVEIPENVSVHVEGLEDDPAERHRIVTYPSGARKSIRTQTIQGIQAFVPKGSSGSMKIDVHGTLLHWTLADKGVVKTAFEGPHAGSIVVEYSNTFENVRIAEAYNTTNDIRVYRNFGISSKAIANRLWIRICPPIYQDGSPAWGVMPQASRGMLISKGSLELPMNDWADEFFRQMPREIQEAIEEDRASRSGASQVTDIGRLKQLTTNLRQRMRLKLTHIAEAAFGALPGIVVDAFTAKPTKPRDPDEDETHPPIVVIPTIFELPSKPRKPAHLLYEDPTGIHKGISKRRSENLPDVDWKSKWDDDPTYAVIFLPKENVRLADGSSSSGSIWFNQAYPMFKTEFEYWIAEYPKANPNDLLDVVKSIYDEDIVTRVCHIKMLEGGPCAPGKRFSNVDVDKLLAPEALTASVLGLTNVEMRIRAAARAKFGKQQVAA